MARETVGDWSNSKPTLMSSGKTACMLGRASLTLRTTERVEASARLVTRMSGRPWRSLTSAYPVGMSEASATVATSRR